MAIQLSTHNVAGSYLELCQCSSCLCTPRNRIRSCPLGSSRSVRPQLYSYHPIGFAIGVCDRRAGCTIGSDIRRSAQRNIWQCCGIDCEYQTTKQPCSAKLIAHQVSIIALRAGEIRIVQASMLGSILSNILLVLGCCFLVGGIRYKEQSFNSTVASTMSSLMTVATASLIIPATLYAVMDDDKSQDDNIMVLSRGTAIILLIIYISYLVFQLKTHADLFNDAEAQENAGEEAQILSAWGAGVALVLVTLLVALCAEFLVDSIDSIVEKAHISKTFIGLILIPIVGNAAEHVTAVIVSWKNKMDLAIGVAIGSSLQIALFVTPFLVILGWAMGREMTLHFETFETVAFFLASLVVILLIQDGKSNYLEGLLCLGMYFIIALAFYVLPEGAGLSSVVGKIVGGT